MEEQIKEQFEKAFFDILDEKGSENPEYLKKLMNEIMEKLCLFVPNRIDLHQKIKDDLYGEVDWDTQCKLLNWAEKFQAPIYDQVTREWKKKCPEPIGQFLKKYYEHLEKINRQIQEYKNSPITLKSGR